MGLLCKGLVLRFCDEKIFLCLSRGFVCYRGEGWAFGNSIYDTSNDYLFCTKDRGYGGSWN